VRVHETVLNHDVWPTGVVEIAADVSDALRVHDVNVLVFAVKLSGRGVLRTLAGRQLGLGRGRLNVGSEAPDFSLRCGRQLACS